MNWTAIFGVVVGLICCAGHPVLAWDEHILCVQEQLQELGYSPGPTDGELSDDVELALQAFLQDSPLSASFEKLPKFSERAAVGWCREIGLSRPEAFGLMPSQRKAHIQSAPDLTAPERAFVQVSLGRAEEFLRQQYGIRLASQVKLAVATDAKQLARLLRIVGPKEVTRQESIGTANFYCGDDNYFSGVAFQSVIGLCWARKEMGFRTWQKQLDLIMVHEFVHHMQRELTYDKSPYRFGTTAWPRGRMGPIWMVEGTAYVASRRYQLDRQGETAEGLSILRAWAREEKMSLSLIRRSGVVRTQEAYDASNFAVFLLAERFGEQSLFDFWRRVGETDNWFDAFEMTYGMEIGQYEQQFHALRDSRDGAYDFVFGRASQSEEQRPQNLME